MTASPLDTLHAHITTAKREYTAAHGLCGCEDPTRCKYCKPYLDSLNGLLDQLPAPKETR